MSRHYQIYPIEREHVCRKNREECVIVGEQCIARPRSVFPLNLESIRDSNFKYLNQVPEFSHSDYFLLQIDFPTAMPLHKLININGLRERFTIKRIISEFITFYIEIYKIEQLTVNEEKVFIECDACETENFGRFARVTEAGKCLICSEEVETNLLVLDCGHKFGAECIEKWFREKNTCPLCRQAIRPCEICAGQREITQSFFPSLETYFQNGITSTGIFRLEPYEIDDLIFTCIIYDREENVFKLRHLAFT